MFKFFPEKGYLSFIKITWNKLEFTSLFFLNYIKKYSIFITISLSFHFNLRYCITHCRRPVHWNLWIYSDIDLYTIFFVTYVSILTFDFFKKFHNFSSKNYKTFHYHKNKIFIYCFGKLFSLYTFSEKLNFCELMIYYDFFKGWLLPSPPFNCVHN